MTWVCQFCGEPGDESLHNCPSDDPEYSEYVAAKMAGELDRAGLQWHVENGEAIARVGVDIVAVVSCGDGTFLAHLYPASTNWPDAIVTFQASSLADACNLAVAKVAAELRKKAQAVLAIADEMEQ